MCVEDMQVIWRDNGDMARFECACGVCGPEGDLAEALDLWDALPRREEFHTQLLWLIEWVKYRHLRREVNCDSVFADDVEEKLKAFAEQYAPESTNE